MRIRFDTRYKLSWRNSILIVISWHFKIEIIFSHSLSLSFSHFLIFSEIEQWMYINHIPYSLFQNVNCSLVCCPKSLPRTTLETCSASMEPSRNARCWGTAPEKVKPVPSLPSLVNNTPSTPLKLFITRKRWRWVELKHNCFHYLCYLTLTTQCLLSF